MLEFEGQQNRIVSGNHRGIGKAGRAAGKYGPQLIAEKPKIMIDHGQALPSVKLFISKNF